MSTSRPLRVYIAGPLSDFPADYLNNCGKMISAWQDINAAGHAAYCPAADLLLGLSRGATNGQAYSVEQYRAWSMAWLDVADVLVVIGWKHEDGRESEGVKAEVVAAEYAGIPVCYDGVEEFRRVYG